MADLLNRNDRAGEHAASWYAAATTFGPEQQPLAGEQRVDVAVVGAGITGLSAALQLAEAGLRVIVLEAHRVGWGASGRNGGQLCTGLRRDQEELEASLGPAAARVLWDQAEAAKALVHDLCRRHRIACGYRPGSLHVAHRRRYLEAYRRHAAKLQDDYGYAAIRFVDGAELPGLLASPRYFGGTLDMGAGHLQPLAYTEGLARAAMVAGARLCERTQVRSVRAEGPRRVVLQADGGWVVAEHAFLAANGYLDALAPEIADRIMPINNFVVATEPLGEAAARALIPSDAAVSDSRFVVNYFRRSADHRLLFGGGETYGYRFPRDIGAFVRPHLEHVFPQLAGVGIAHGWGGTLAITRSRLPLFVRLRPNVVFAGGFSGMGLALGTLAGRLAAEAIRGHAEGFDHFARLRHAPFPGGRHARAPLLALAMTWFALRDRI